VTLADPKLSSLLSSTNPEDRKKAVLLLVRQRPDGVQGILEHIAQGDSTPAIRYLARKALSYLAEGADSLIAPAAGTGQHVFDANLLEDGDPARRARGIDLAIRMGDRVAATRMVTIAGGDPVLNLRIQAFGYFEQHGLPEDLPSLIKLLRDPVARIRAGLARVLPRCAPRQSIPYLAYLMQDQEQEVRRAARSALGGRSRDEVLAELDSMTRSRETWMRDTAAFTLGLFQDANVVGSLTYCLADPHEMVRKKAQQGLETLVRQGNAEAARVLKAPPSPRDLRPLPAAATSPSDSSRRESPLAADILVGGRLASGPRSQILALTQAVQNNERAFVPEILTQMGVETNPFVLSRQVISLGHLGSTDDGDMIQKLLQHEDSRVVASAIESLDRLGHTRSRQSIRPMLGHKISRIRANALLYFFHHLPEANPDSELEHLDSIVGKMLSGKQFPEKLSALHVIAGLSPEKYTNHLEIVLADINDHVRETAFLILQKWSDEGHVDAKAMLEMCVAGDVAIKEESLFLQKAPAVRRVLAYACDFLVIIPGTLIVCGLLHGLPGVLGQVGGAVALAFGTWLFFVRDSFNDGRGFAKKLFGLRCVDLASNRGCSKSQSLFRQAFVGLGLVGPVELVLLHIDSSGRRVGDRLVNTQVIDELDSPLTGTETSFAVCIYIMIFSVFSGSVVELFSSSQMELKSPQYGYRIQLPKGWRFTATAGDQVGMVRRSLFRGQELTVQMQTGSRSNETPTTDVPGELETEVKDFIKVMGEGFEVRESSLDLETQVGGEPAVSCDVIFVAHGNRGMIRGIKVHREKFIHEFLIIAGDFDVFQARESEVSELLRQVSFSGS